MLDQIIQTVFDLCNSLGILAIPVSVLAVVVLIFLAKRSYRIFNFLLPILAGVAGAFIGIASVRGLGKIAPSLKEIPNLGLIVGIIFGIILALICIKRRGFAMVLVGAGIGAVLLGDVLKSWLESFDYIKGIAGATGNMVSYIIGAIISIICLIIGAFIFKKFFKAIYIILTSIGCSVVAFAFVGALAFGKLDDVSNVALLICIVIGLIYGLVACVKQFKRAALDD